MADTNIVAIGGTASTSIEQIEPAGIDAVWAACEAGIGTALCEYMPGLVTVTDCRTLCTQGALHLWVATQQGQIVGWGLAEIAALGL
jgi:hypothetical protein